MRSAGHKHNDRERERWDTEVIGSTFHFPQILPLMTSRWKISWHSKIHANLHACMHDARMKSKRKLQYLLPRVVNGLGWKGNYGDMQIRIRLQLFGFKFVDSIFLTMSRLDDFLFCILKLFLKPVSFTLPVTNRNFKFIYLINYFY